MKNTKSGYSLIVITAIIAAAIALFSLGGYLYWQRTKTSIAPSSNTNVNPEMPVSKNEAPPITPANVDDLDKELSGMETDNISDNITPNDYSGL